MIIPLVGMFIPIIAIVMGIGIGMLAIILQHRKRKEMFALYHQERMAALEKGVELPPMPEAFFVEGEMPRRRSPHRRLLRGLVLTFVGITLFIALHFNQTESRVDLYALIPLGIGLAYLIFYFAVDRKHALEAEAARATETTDKV